MKQTLFFLTIVFFSINALAQDQKWSLEASYPIFIGNKIGNDNPGIGDLGIKYRFLNFDFVQIGVGLNVSLFKDRIQGFTIPETMDFKEKNWIFQPKIFAEFHIPSMPRLHPSIGLGYTQIDSRFRNNTPANMSSFSVVEDGFNLSLGLSYDISKKVFILVQYDVIFSKTSNMDFTRSANNYGILKFGLGFRF